MQISNEHIASKKKVGTLRGNPVIELVTTGGLHLVVTSKGSSVETLAAGPHRAVARHIAMKREQDIVWSDLSKGDYVEEEVISFLLPKYEALTDRLRNLGSE